MFQHHQCSTVTATRDYTVIMRERYLYETKNAGVGASGPNRDLYQERLELAGIAGTTYEPYQRKSHHR